MIYSDFAFIFLFIVAGLIMLTVILLIAKALRPSHPGHEKLTSYESGEDTVGDAVIGFKSNYFIVALIFILFEVELVLLFPWSTVFGNEAFVSSTNGAWGWFTIAEMFLFIFVLAIGLVYVWAQGHLDWLRASTEANFGKSLVPKELYDNINEKYK